MPDPEPAAPPADGRPPPLATGLAFVLVGVLVVHFAVTFLWNAPPNPVKEVIGGQVSSYMRPFFVQNWSLFAPDPINTEEEILVRAKVSGPDGETEVTPWVSATEREWLVVDHNPVPSRASRLSSNLHRRLMSAWRRLSEEQRLVLTEPYDGTADWTVLADDLTAATRGAEDGRVATMVRADRVATAYATQVARALWGDDVGSVQIRLRSTPVPRWPDRFVPEPDPATASVRQFGWRPVLVAAGQDDDAFAAAFRGFGP